MTDKDDVAAELRLIFGRQHDWIITLGYEPRTEQAHLLGPRTEKIIHVMVTVCQHQIVLGQRREEMTPQPKRMASSKGIIVVVPDHH
jgi:hypothetical protein